MFRLKANRFDVQAALLPAGILVFIIGCGSGSPTRVSGTATHNGSPVPGVIVNLVSDSGKLCRGTADENGNFHIDTDSRTKGVPPGKYKVFVEFKPRSPLEEGQDASQRTDLSEVQKTILLRYGLRDAPAVEITVEKKEKHIDLKLD